MSAAEKFNVYTLVMAVVAIFLGVTELAPYLNATFGVHATLAVSVLTSVGIYRALAAFFGQVIQRFGPLFRVLMGPAYVCGTWGGLIYTKTGQPRIIVEKYEQTLGGVKVFGQSFFLDQRKDANWSTQAVQVHEKEGFLVGVYSVNVPDKQTIEAYGKLDFDRSDSRDGPTAMTGYTIDADATQKLHYYRLVKLSNKLLDIDEARRQTFKAFDGEVQRLRGTEKV